MQAKFQFLTQALEYLQVFQFWVVACSEVAARAKPPALPVRCSKLPPVRLVRTEHGGVPRGSPEEMAGVSGWWVCKVR